MKKIFYFIVVVGSLISINSCKSPYDIGMKSTDYKVIIPIANNYFERGKWEKAITLYERSAPFVAGTDSASLVAYNTATANYKDKNYRLAGHRYKGFANTFYKDPRAEEALFLSAYCYYIASSEYNLDQKDTDYAIVELQNFVNKYPNSEKIKESNNYLNELQQKLEKKAFENAKTLYKIGQYKAAGVTFENVLNQYPDTDYKEEILIYILRSKSQLGIHSRFDKKKDRLTDALTSYKQLIKQYPNSEYTKEAEKIKKEVENEIINFNQLNEKIKNQTKS